MLTKKPPIPRPMTPPIDKRPGETVADDGTVTVTQREPPKWFKWSTYGSCSHDPECRPKMIGVALVAIVGAIVLAGWIGGKDHHDDEEN
jgi:hypothetical protein